MAAQGPARLNSLVTTVVTPSKCAGRHSPSSRLVISPTETCVWNPAGYIDSGAGVNTKIHATFAAAREVAFEGLGVAVEVLAGPELQWVDEDGHRDEVGSRLGCLDEREVPLVEWRPWSARARRCGSQRAHHRRPAGSRQACARLWSSLRPVPRVGVPHEAEAGRGNWSLTLLHVAKAILFAWEGTVAHFVTIAARRSHTFLEKLGVSLHELPASGRASARAGRNRRALARRSGARRRCRWSGCRPLR